MFDPCSGCQAPCCKRYLVTVTSFDVLRIARKTGRRPEEFAQLYPAKLLNQDWRSVILTFDDGDLPDYHVLALESWPCKFLENNRCSIHEFSPLGCRRYPFDRDGRLHKRDCSLLSRLYFRLKGPTDGGMLCELDSYWRIVKEWNDSKGRKKGCMGFLMRRTADFKEYAD